MRILRTTLLAAATVVALAACGSSSSSSSSSAASATSSAAAPSSSSATLPGAGKPAVVLGDKNFTEEFILGSLYQEALEAQGYKVTLKGNIGSSELIWKALKSGQIQGYPEYTGTLLSAVAGQTSPPKSALDAYNEAKAYAEKNGFTLLDQTPFYDSDALGALKSYASKNGLTTISDLKKLGTSVKLGGAPEFATRTEGLVGLKQQYGIDPTFKPLAIGLTYKALDSGQVQVSDVFTTDPQLTTGKYTLLTDPKKVFGFQNVAPVIEQSVVAAEGPAFAATLNKVSALLTLTAIQKMNAAVALEQQSPASVAHQFLAANGLLK
jgi:osmoprotectant transport system substrate-binding protein